MTDNKKFELSTFVSYTEVIPNIVEDTNSHLDLSKNPRDVKEYLDKFIIGQHEAKKVLSIAACHRGVRLMTKHATGKSCIEKSNILLLGPTGCGKTLLIKTLAAAVGAVCIVEDATTFTATGYVGREITDIFEHLLSTCISRHPALPNESLKEWGTRIKLIAESSVIYIDEIDKISQPAGRHTNKFSVEIQEELLKIIEGTLVQLQPTRDKRLSSAERLQIDEIDTTDMLFIAGGSFHGLEEIIQKRTASSTIGFGGKVHSVEVDKDILCEANNDDLIKFGVIPEFLGRFHTHVGLKSLTESDLVDILTLSEGNQVDQYTHLFHYYNRAIVFTPKALLKIASIAIKSKAGARGLKRIMERSLRDFMFEVPDEGFGPPIEIEEEHIRE